jgi:hypothetical protein
MDNLYLASGGAQLEVNKQRDARLAEQERNSLQQQQQDQQAYIQEEQNRRAQEEWNLKKQAFEEQKQSEKLMASAFASTIPERAGIAEEEGMTSLAEKTAMAAKKLMATNPKMGLDLLEKSQKYKEQAISNKVQNATFKQAQMEIAGQIASTVTDQQSLDEALPELFKNGVVVPDRFKKWGAETKNWFVNRAVFSKNAMAEIKLQNTLELTRLKELEDKSKQDKRDADIKAQEQKQIAARDKLKTTAALKNVPIDYATLEASDLAETNDAFANLESSTQIIAAKDIYSTANSLVANQEASTFPEALTKAREIVLSKIDPKTNKYLGFQTQDIAKPTASNVASPKTQAEFNSIPSGGLYINPKDGKQYRKK